jgi:hypothetical protein
MQSSIVAEELEDDPAFKVALAMTLLIWALGGLPRKPVQFYCGVKCGIGFFGK